MRVDLHNQKGIVGEVTLSGDGEAIPSNDVARRTIEETVITAPGPRVVTPADGETYLRALPFCLNGSYFWAEFVE